MMPAEERIRFGMKDDQLRAAFGEEFNEIPAPGTVHQFDRNLQLPLLDRLKLEQLFTRLHIRGLRIKRRALIRPPHRALESPTLLDARLNIRFDLFRNFRRSSRAVARGEFQPLILSRIMT